MRLRFAVAFFGLFALAASAETTSFGVSMEGASEIPAGDTNGMGFADLTLDGTTLRYAVVVFNIDQPMGMHIHRGRRGEASLPFITFPPGFTRYPGCPSLGAPVCAERFVIRGELEISGDDARALRDEPSNFYLNVHNDAHPAGAVRGQVQHARYLPIVGQTPGAAGTHWFTRFAVLNRSTVDTSPWQMEFLPQSPTGNTDRYLQVQSAIAPLNLHVSFEFPVPSYTGIGAMRILADEPMETAASIYNGAGGPRGDFGYSVEGKTLDEARTSGLLVDLTTSSAADIGAGVGHRANIGYFNPQPVSVDATFRAYARSGSLLGEKTLTIPP
ncbi:MAG TPA: CHRD domain-containing protein, partial [Thermoanaerobaculia bacterium]